MTEACSHGKLNSYFHIERINHIGDTEGKLLDACEYNDLVLTLHMNRGSTLNLINKIQY